MAKKISENQLASWLGDVEEDIQVEQIVAALDKLFISGPTEKAISRAKGKLIKIIEKSLPREIFYSQIEDTPFGDIWVASSEIGLVAVEYDLDEAFFLERVHKLTGGRLVATTNENSEAVSQIRAYLEAETTRLDLKVDLSVVSDFRRKVLEATAQIEHGQVVTYADIAKQIGKPKAFRAVGQALRYNPIPIVIPCHRVIASDGTLGGYDGAMGDARKIRLLKLEGVMLA
ncbi:MAG: methylated-DNA--[protein]-cysteine S-methyltransferase [Chloroflexi bacterium]|nr:methylated-DNA--[protein]-cysteine S-methyltransferase [Chloroflexota bacterium]